MLTQAALHACPFVECSFLMAVISQETIFNYAKFLQCNQGDNGPLSAARATAARVSNVNNFFLILTHIINFGQRKLVIF